LRKQHSLSQSGNFELQCSLLLQKRAIAPHPEQNESSLHIPILFLSTPILYYPLISDFLVKNLYAFLTFYKLQPFPSLFDHPTAYVDDYDTPHVIVSTLFLKKHHCTM
jgi:hypothetical protein